MEEKLDVAVQAGNPDQKKLIIKEIIYPRELEAFIGFPYLLYRGNPFYVPPLKSDERKTLRLTNPAFDHCEAKYWLAYRSGKIVGRIAGIINHGFIDRWGKKYARFGWFDFKEDETIAQALLHHVERWAKEKGMDAVHGPMGFTNFDPAGLLVDGFNQLATLSELYNYPYYPDCIEKAGYHKEVDWIEYRISIPKKVPEKVRQVATIVKRRSKLSVVNLNESNSIMTYAHSIFELINVCYGHLHGMVPLTEKQIQYYTKRYLSFIRKDYVSLVVDSCGTLIAFGITMPSLSKALQKANGTLFPFGLFHILKALRKNNTAELCLVAIRPDYQGKGVNALVMEEMNKAFNRNNITMAESNPELEDNKQVQSLWSYYEAEQHKRRRCYIKYL
ncbi:MAG: GNAT family N-acetyltransferase [Cyclobacteriaceae bacterium]|nr:MAG: GNAT family N-acetyltransferase [Cyclobacteriaceae bacterium]